jgi:general secretion pathway protein G
MEYIEILLFGRIKGRGDSPRSSGIAAHWLNDSSGFTLVELLIVCALISTVSLIIIPRVLGIGERTRNMQAMADLSMMDADIDVYIMDHNVPPDSLAEVGYDNYLDPWGNPYQYLRIFESTEPGLNGKQRKDHSLVPVNSDYDLYSKGPDGDSKAPFTAKASRDDIVRASDGNFIGPVSEF